MKNRSLSIYEYLIGLTIVVFFVSLIAWGVTKKQMSVYPPKEDILPQLLQEPLQRPVSQKPFTIVAEGKEYLIEPVYAYQLYGMIVSYNQSSPLYQIVHWLGWKDYINVKDICVIWGDNLVNEVYEGMNFTNATYTCYPRYKAKTAETYYHLFNGDQLSNNHLLSNDKKMKELLWSSIRGDQVYVKGYLARYSHSQGRFRRGTSTVRTDKGNGACETVFLTEFGILKKAHPLARRINKISFWSMIISFILYLWLDPFFDTFRPKGKSNSWWHRLMAVSDRRIK